MMTRINKQKEILSNLNDEIEDGIDQLRIIAEKLKKTENVQSECNEFIADYTKEMPRVERLHSSLQKKVLELERNKYNSTKQLLTMKDDVIEFQRKLNESGPNLARY